MSSNNYNQSSNNTKKSGNINELGDLEDAMKDLASHMDTHLNLFITSNKCKRQEGAKMLIKLLQERKKEYKITFQNLSIFKLNKI